MRAFPVVGDLRRRVFTAAEAHAAGWSDDALARAVRSGRLVRLRRGVYVPAWTAGDPTPSVRRADIDLARRAIAAALTSEAVVVSQLGAVELHRWPVWAPVVRDCVTVTDGRTRVPGAHVHRTPLGAEVAIGSGFRVTRPTRTVIDVACEYGTEAGLVVADAAVAAGRTTRERLSAAIAQAAGRTGIAAARPLGTLVDGRAESPLESRSRWQCVRWRVPQPRPQVELFDLDGRFLGRSDLYWDVGVVGEVDGAGKLAEQGARKALLQRQLGFTRARLRIVRWGERELSSFGPTAAWLLEELAAAAADPQPRRWHVAPGRADPSLS